MQFSKINPAICILLFLPLVSICQQDTTRKDELNASVNYQTALHYFGRTDSLKSSGEFASIGFKLRSGLYAQGNFIFVQNTATTTNYAGTTIEAGYHFPQTKHFSGNVFYTAILYNNKSDLVQSALKSQTGINLAYTNPIITLSGGMDLKFSDKTDMGATFELDHIFIYKPGDGKLAFAFDPSAYVYAGTQNFSTTYIQKQNLLGIPISQQQVTTNATTFSILAYEFSAPLVFVAGKFNVSVTPSYVVPQNLISVAGHPELSEHGQPMFYAVLSMGLKL